MAEDKNTVMSGAWAARAYPGGVNANLQNVMDALTALPAGKDSTAKVLEGTDQNGAPICVVFWKYR